MSKTVLELKELEQNFAELHPNYSRDEATMEASRCVYCYDAPCMRACPTHIDIPKFIRQILHNNPLGSAQTIFEENIFGGSCARACPTEVLCEGACVDQTLLKAPVEIGRLQRYATDYASERKARFFEPGPDTGKKVAIVGGGPAGMSCAHELRRAGHAVTVFEATEVLGGLNTIGLAAYKVSTDFALSELDPILDMGVEVKTNSWIDKEKLASLREEFDAVFIGVGMGPTIELDLPGEEAKGVWEAMAFIYQTHRGKLTDCVVGENVIIIGAGNTAIDTATEAVRLGAKSVTMAYRRTAQEMSAYAYEYELAKSDGVRFEWNIQPVEFVSEDGKLTGVKFVRNELQGEGREAKLKVIEGSEFVMPCDMAVKSLGQKPFDEFLSGIEGAKFDKGRLAIEKGSGATGVPGLFAGGDCTSKGAEVVNAVQAGKLAAKAIDKYLKEGAE